MRFTGRSGNPLRWHHRVGWFGTCVLMVPILAWVWMAAAEPFLSVLNGSVLWFVLSGEVFTRPFHRVHAGFSMDQPTIGKWLFWFTFMAVTALPCAAAVRWFSDRSHRGGYLAFGIGAAALAVLLLSMLSWPTCWLVQYICSMGFTLRRLLGLCFAAGSGVAVLGFVGWAFRR